MNAASSSQGPSRLSRGPFVLGAALAYVLSFLSQTLLSAPVTAHFGVAPFSLAQAALIAAWVVLHLRRLRDAGRPAGLVIGVAAVYALEVVLLVALVWLMLPSSADGGGVGPDAPILRLFVLIYFLALLSGDPSLGAMQAWIAGFIVMMLLPIAIALGFTGWAATRPSAPVTP